MTEMMELKEQVEGGSAVDVAEQDDQDLRQGEWLLCAFCRTPIVRADDAIEVGGKHEHVEANPEGIVYHIGCFRNALVLPVGAVSSYWSWFQGYSWQVAACPYCGSHLGWQFRSSSDSFHGLILGRLVEEEAKTEQG